MNNKIKYYTTKMIAEMLNYTSYITVATLARKHGIGTLFGGQYLFTGKDIKKFKELSEKNPRRPKDFLTKNKKS